MADVPAKTARAEWGTRFGFLMAMIGGMVVLVSFPIVGYVLVSVLEGRRGDRKPAGVAGGDD